MKPEFKKKLLKALRSGKYRKTKGCLRRRDNCYCVLGVVCDIVRPGKVIPRNKLIHDEVTNYNREFESKYGDKAISGSLSGLPDDIGKITGIDFREECFLFKRNDRNNESFTRLADWIERNF